ncbi:MAG: hypothetical protein NDI94_03780 [Candidatus Woesearchaeota archaeon]|nr:hypothetical protein [Candidatus Woesearchaeota archaeon]
MWKALVLILLVSCAPLKEMIETEIIETYDKNHIIRLDESISLATRYLIVNQKKEGNFNYEYDYISSQFSVQDNGVRQAGALWGLVLAYSYTKDDTLVVPIKKGLDYFQDRSYGKEGRRWIIYSNETEASTGMLSLYILSVNEFLKTYESDDGYEEILHDDLKEYIAQLIYLKTTENLFYSRYSLEGEGYGDPSPYFDGESLLALSKIDDQELVSKELLISIADATYNKYVEDALENNPDSDKTKGFFQWGIMSYYELTIRGYADYSDRIFLLADWMIDVHKTLGRQKNTGYAIEGLSYAYRLAKKMEDKRYQKYKLVISETLKKLMSWQIGSPLANWFITANPPTDEYAVGGIMNAENDPVLRIDVTQHQLHAMLLAKEYVFNDEK